MYSIDIIRGEQGSLSSRHAIEANFIDPCMHAIESIKLRTYIQSMHTMIARDWIIEWYITTSIITHFYKLYIDVFGSVLHKTGAIHVSIMWVSPSAPGVSCHSVCVAGLLSCLCHILQQLPLLQWSPQSQFLYPHHLDFLVTTKGVRAASMYSTCSIAPRYTCACCTHSVHIHTNTCARFQTYKLHQEVYVHTHLSNKPLEGL